MFTLVNIEHKPVESVAEPVEAPDRHKKRAATIPPNINKIFTFIKKIIKSQYLNIPLLTPAKCSRQKKALLKTRGLNLKNY